MALTFKKDAEGKLVLNDEGDPILIEKVVLEEKHERVKTELANERDDLKTQVDELTKQIGEVQKSTGDAEALKAQLETITKAHADFQADADARMAAKDREYALDTALLGAGIPSERLKAAKALVGDVELKDGKLAGFDAEAFKKDNAYLFPQQDKFSTGAASSGQANNEEAEQLAAMRDAAGLPPKKE
jgi:hypothetical protein